MRALRELLRLNEALSSRQATLYDLDGVEVMGGLGMSSFYLPAPELSHELSPRLPAGPDGVELVDWKSWRKFAHIEHDAAEARLQRGETQREERARDELQVAILTSLATFTALTTLTVLITLTTVSILTTLTTLTSSAQRTHPTSTAPAAGQRGGGGGGGAAGDGGGHDGGLAASRRWSACDRVGAARAEETVPQDTDLPPCAIAPVPLPAAKEAADAAQAGEGEDGANRGSTGARARAQRYTCAGMWEYVGQLHLIWQVSSSLFGKSAPPYLAGPHILRRDGEHASLAP